VPATRLFFIRGFSCIPLRPGLSARLLPRPALWTTCPHKMPILWEYDFNGRIPLLRYAVRDGIETRFGHAVKIVP